jgi:hypothetical protein
MILINGKIPTRTFNILDCEAGGKYYGISPESYKRMIDHTLVNLGEPNGPIFDPEKEDDFDTH